MATNLPIKEEIINYEVEIKKEQNEFDYVMCLMCGLNFENQDDLLEHKKVHFIAYRNIDTKCNLTIEHESQKETKFQCLIEAEKKIHTCVECQQSFIDTCLLLNHLKSTHGNEVNEEQYHCVPCRKQFKELYHLTQHMDMHTRPPYYSCLKCEKRFKLKRYLREHMRLDHKTERQYKCKFCEKQFSEKTGLAAHLVSHSDERPYTCNTCNKSFKTKSSLNGHIEIHTAGNKYQCKLCKKQFNTKRSLANHKKCFIKVSNFTQAVLQKTSSY